MVHNNLKNLIWIWSMYKVNKKSIKMEQLFLLEKASNIYEKEFIIRKTISDCKKWKLWNILSLQASYLVPTSGNSLVVRRVSPDKKTVLLFWAK